MQYDRLKTVPFKYKTTVRQDDRCEAIYFEQNKKTKKYAIMETALSVSSGLKEFFKMYIRKIFRKTV